MIRLSELIVGVATGVAVIAASDPQAVRNILRAKSVPRVIVVNILIFFMV
jgi:hypothetical protein